MRTYYFEDGTVVSANNAMEAYELNKDENGNYKSIIGSEEN